MYFKNVDHQMKGMRSFNLWDRGAWSKYDEGGVNVGQTQLIGWRNISAPSARIRDTVRRGGQ